ncbi:hypothetical protein DPMN_023233, partial [Dreissena polymorpha]
EPDDYSCRGTTVTVTVMVTTLMPSVIKVEMDNPHIVVAIQLHTSIKPLPDQRICHPQKKQAHPEQHTNRPHEKLAHRRLHPLRHHHNRIALSSVWSIPLARYGSDLSHVKPACNHYTTEPLEKSPSN